MSSFKTETKLQLIYFDIIYSMQCLNHSFIESTYAHSRPKPTKGCSADWRRRRRYAHL